MMRGCNFQSRHQGLMKLSVLVFLFDVCHFGQTWEEEQHEFIYLQTRNVIIDQCKTCHTHTHTHQQYY